MTNCCGEGDPATCLPPCFRDAARLAPECLRPVGIDDGAPVCHSPAIAEAFTTSGQWEPVCERHAGQYAYDPSRLRPLR